MYDFILSMFRSKKYKKMSIITSTVARYVCVYVCLSSVCVCMCVCLSSVCVCVCVFCIPLLLKRFPLCSHTLLCINIYIRDTVL